MTHYFVKYTVKPRQVFKSVTITALLLKWTPVRRL